MKAKATALVGKVKRYKVLMIGLLAAIAVLIVWVMPLQSDVVFLRFGVEGVADKTPAVFEIFSDEAYYTSCSVESEVMQGAVECKLDNEYLSVERICVMNPQVAKAITWMDVRGSVVWLSDFSSAFLADNVVSWNTDGVAVLTDEALQTIYNGIDNPWFARACLTALILACTLAVVLYVTIKRRFGTIKALTAAGMVVGGLVLTVLSRDYFNGQIPVKDFYVPSGIPFLMMLAVFTVLLIACLLAVKPNKTSKRLIVVVYIVVLLFSMAKMVFYSERVGNTPDELAHIGYVAHVAETGEIVPSFEDMKLTSLISKDGYQWRMSFNENSTCYLVHPPLYYLVMQLADGVTFHEDGTLTADMLNLRFFSMGIAVLAIILMFYIGYSRIKASPLVHLVYAAVCTSVPMLIYGASGLNNDTLTFLTIAVFFLGILRYLEKRYNWLTYALIAVGICATMLTKLTAGLMVVVAAVIVLAVTLVREKNFKDVFKPAFLVTLPIYLLPLMYYLSVYVRYDSFQPGLFSLAPEFAHTTGFYVNAASRASQSVVSYIVYFFDNFMKSWTGISSHISLLKRDIQWSSVQNIALVAIWFSPILFAKKSLRNKSPYSVGVVAICAGIAITLAMQLLNGYDGFITRGYMGGFQSRYYLCIVMVLAFGMAVALQYTLKSLDKKQKHTRWLRESVEAMAVLYVGILFYEDFMYFLLHYRQYIGL